MQHGVVELVTIMIAVAIISAWEVVGTRRQGHEEVEMLSQITATFSVGLCAKSEGSTVCQTTETHTIHVVGITHLPGKPHLLRILDSDS